MSNIGHETRHLKHSGSYLTFTAMGIWRGRFVGKCSGKELYY
jgi:hypothetical protein